MRGALSRLGRTQQNTRQILSSSGIGARGISMAALSQGGGIGTRTRSSNTFGVNLHNTQVRTMAISDTIMGMAEKSMSGNKEKQFQEMMDMMTSVPKWSLKPWKKTMDSQLNSWMMYVPGVSSSDEVKEIKEFKNMLDSMSDAELDNPEAIDGPARAKIAAKAGKTVDDVTRMLFFYKQSLIIASWLQMKKKAGEAMPATEQELQELQASDGRLGNIARKVMSPKGKKSGRGRRLPF